ncbi:serine/threonine protein kinase-transforming protein Rmil, putative [Entamoeba invadens IP1]|uniref:Serine/threonine protein kinase-transforming protein Rmil, putative n=1 Tax=Entamoeba invadens IP1 TaxID=370355 RepID=A0A0A1UFT0_ENTIV|nr:serine/threonine protein kinase-transforming protein Rmil, putative [Entamoeba invadens IP1]ELP91894.1 serine/threonine protein kinase-transforming protein Rmil, putative [Entamoeba invadens IP1]|eukprot:XP_004258665.1 serine/threonine protein kinase-transforming protein Rmil, putative [Entamoeba invadens IP1]
MYGEGNTQLLSDVFTFMAPTRTANLTSLLSLQQTTQPLDTVLLPNAPPQQALESFSYLQSQNALISPEEVADYQRRGELIGEGSFGIVFQSSLPSKYKNSRFQRVAIKVLKNQQMTPNENEQFMTEMSVLSSLSHDNIVAFFKACVIVPFRAILTEYVANGTLRSYLEANDITFKRGLDIMKQISTGMLYLHSHNPPILHLDLKSENLLVSSDGTVKITDFGLSFFMNENVYQNAQKRMIRGTPGYCSPESIDVVCFHKLPLDKKMKSDIYSFGIVFWEVIYKVYTKKYAAPYSEYPQLLQRPLALMNQVSSDATMLRPTVPPQCDGDVSMLIQTCTAQHYDNRPTFREILDVLDSFTRILEVKNTPLIKQSIALLTPRDKIAVGKKQERTDVVMFRPMSEERYVLREFRCGVLLYNGENSVVNNKIGMVKIVIETKFKFSIQIKFKDNEQIVRVEIPWFCLKSVGMDCENGSWVGLLQMNGKCLWSVGGKDIGKGIPFDQFELSLGNELMNFIEALGNIASVKDAPGKHIINVLNTTKVISFQKVKQTDCKRRLFQN